MAKEFQKRKLAYEETLLPHHLIRTCMSISFNKSSDAQCSV